MMATKWIITRMDNHDFSSINLNNHATASNIFWLTNA